jgi:hypothetical protein
MSSVSFPAPGADSGSVVVCSNGDRARLVLSVAPNDGDCRRIQGESYCLQSDCTFQTTLAYSTRGAGVEIRKSTGLGYTSLGLFPDTMGVLTNVTGEINLQWNVPCGLGQVLKYQALSQGCSNPTPVTVEADMSCSTCVYSGP